MVVAAAAAVVVTWPVTKIVCRRRRTKPRRFATTTVATAAEASDAVPASALSTEVWAVAATMTRTPTKTTTRTPMTAVAHQSPCVRLPAVATRDCLFGASK